MLVFVNVIRAELVLEPLPLAVCPVGPTVHRKAACRPPKGSPFTPEEDTKLIKLKETQGLSWERIKRKIPHRSVGSLSGHYYAKLK